MSSMFDDCGKIGEIALYALTGRNAEFFVFDSEPFDALAAQRLTLRLLPGDSTNAYDIILPSPLPAGAEDDIRSFVERNTRPIQKCANRANNPASVPPTNGPRSGMAE
jgi:hypothetical protein